MKTILVATDFSERSDRALRRATLLARQSGAGLSLVHVVDDDQPRRIVDSERELASELLREQAATVRSVDGVACDARIILADPFAGIVHAAQDTAADLLVVGPHRRQALRDVFVGTTAERTIRSVACPVLMANAPPVGAYHHVLLAVDLGEGAGHMVRRFADLDLAPRAARSLLHVFNAEETRLAMSHALDDRGRRGERAAAQGEAEAALAAFAEDLEGASGGAWTRRLVRPQRSSAAETILAAADEQRAECIVVATRRKGLAKAWLGSVVEEVLRHAGRDVLAIPPHDRAGG